MPAPTSLLHGFDPTLLLVLNLAGTFVFGLSGGLAGVRARLDLFGVVVLAVVVGLTGGITRDLLIGVPPETFRDWRYLAVAGGAGLVTFLAHSPLGRIAGPIDLLDAITRIVEAEAQASGAPKPPEITPLDRYQLVRNDPDAATRVRAALQARFGEERVVDIPPISASEDFGSFGSEWHVPAVFWTVGGTDPDAYREAKEAGRLSELPTNHNPRFAPVLHPTLETGVETLVAAASAWLAA